MRTTVDIPDAKYRLLKGKVVEDLLMRVVDVVLSEQDAPRKRRLKLPLIDSDRPGSLEMDNEKIYGLIGFP
jgi:hypothetical protein